MCIPFFKFLYQNKYTFYWTWASFQLTISTINSHCFGSICSAHTKQLYQFTSLFPWKYHLLCTKRNGLSWTWRNNLPTLFILQAVLCKCSGIGSSTAYPSELWKMYRYAFRFIVFGHLQWSSLQMFYAANLMCLVSMSFKVFPCSDHFARIKSECCH